MRSTRSRSSIEPLLARLLGYQPVAAPPHVFALAPRELRYARFLGGDSRWRLGEVNRVELPGEAFGPGLLGGPLRDPADFKGRLGSLLGQSSAAVADASLVLPDAWLRLAFLESDLLPREGQARDEVLRWKLKRLVPFRVDDLRVAAAAAEPLPGQAEPERLMVGFAAEALLGQVEDAFAGHGVHLGRVTCDSLGLLEAVRDAIADAPLGALARVRDDGYTLMGLHAGELVLHRFKPQVLSDATAPLIERDLKLTVTYLTDSFPQSALERCLLLAPPAQVAGWTALLGAGLECAVEPITAAHLPLGGEDASDWSELAPLLGAALREVDS